MLEIKDKVNYSGTIPQGIGWKLILISRQATEHLNLDYQVKTKVEKNTINL